MPPPNYVLMMSEIVVPPITRPTIALITTSESRRKFRAVITTPPIWDSVGTSYPLNLGCPAGVFCPFMFSTAVFQHGLHIGNWPGAGAGVSSKYFLCMDLLQVRHRFSYRPTIN
jgi:hypothetical protein